MHVSFYSERKGSKWISGLLRKQNDHSTPNKDKLVKKPRRRGSDPSEWNIPSPPPVPKIKYLLSKHKRAQSSQKQSGVKKDVVAPKWGRDAYDDGMESDESSIGGSRENLNQIKTAQLLQQKSATSKAAQTKTAASLKGRNQPEIKKGMGARKDTPRPADIQQATSVSDGLQPIPFKLDEAFDEDTVQHSAPIARLTNTRKQSKSPTPKPRSSDHYNNDIRTVTTTQGRSQLTVPGFQRQGHIVEEEAPDYDDSNEAESSSDDEETTESESTESESDTEEEDDEDRPIMAQNVGIHGARIAKQVMQRMKNQRYPSIFSKPIITLDTIVDVRYEKPYQTVSEL